MSTGRQLDATPPRGTPPAEHVLNIFKAILATTPFTGGISSLLTDYIPCSRQKRLETFAEEVARDLQVLSDKVNASNLLTDEFSYIFEQSFRGAAECYQREKLGAFRGILVNSAVANDVQQDEKEYFLVLANKLSALHLRILAFLVAPRDYLTKHGINEHSVRGGFSQMFAAIMPEVGTSVVESAFGDLYQLGLITTDKSIFHTSTSAQGLRLLGDRMSELGHTFIRFCTAPAP